MMDAMDETRARSLNEGTPQSGPVLYWMSRDQRAADNWALHFAQEYALRQRVPLAVVFCLLPVFGEATIRQYGFMLRGLTQKAARLREVGTPFFLLEGTPTLASPAIPCGMRLKRKWFAGEQCRAICVCLQLTRLYCPCPINLPN
jgi:hypothetical protein